MEYRIFGKTGWKVSEIGFGGWQLGGTWGAIDEHESIDTLLYAFEKGVNFVDTAVAYGAGKSESVIGKALLEWKANTKIFVATKVMPILMPMTSLDVDQNPVMRGRYPAWYLRQMVEGSLKRLNVDQIDLLQLHLWLESGISELDWLETLNELRIEGKVDRIGVSLADIRPESGLKLARFGLVDSIQLIYNMFEQEPAMELFPAGQQSHTAFIARVPFDSGALTGTWTVGTYRTWDSEDKRHLMYRGKRFEETLERVEQVKKICSPYYETLAEAAIRFVLAQAAVGVVIPGMRNKNEVDWNITYSDKQVFPTELLEKLKPFAWKHEFYH